MDREKVSLEDILIGAGLVSAPSAVFCLIVGFALGGAFVAAIGHLINQRPPITTTIPTPGTNQHQPAKTFGERLSIIWDRTWEDPVAFYTFVLSIFTLCLVVVSLGQGYFLFRSDRSTRIAANAAQLSAEAAIAIELPFIRVSPPEDLTKVENIEDDGGGLVWDVEDTDLPEFSRIYTLKFRNIGRTTATPTKLELGWKVTSSLPTEEPVYTWSRSCEHGTVLPGDNNPYAIECVEFCIALTEEERGRVYENAAALWVFGALTYRDFLDEPHVTRFCWRWGCPDGVGLYHFYRDEHTPGQYTTKS